MRQLGLKGEKRWNLGKQQQQKVFMIFDHFAKVHLFMSWGMYCDDNFLKRYKRNTYLDEICLFKYFYG